MPTETLIVVSVMTAAFLLFAAVLFWAESQTRDLRRE